jgi:hypothetical protein
MTRKKASSCKIIFSILFLLLNLCVCAQTKPIIKKAHSFFTAMVPGNIPVDRDGREIPIAIDTAIVIYVEATTKLIKWDTAWFKGKSYLIITQAVTEGAVEVGIVRGDDKKTILKTPRNNFMWQLYLQPSPQQKIIYNLSGKNQIILKGKYKGKPFFQKAPMPVQLEGIPSV